MFATERPIPVQGKIQKFFDWDELEVQGFCEDLFLNGYSMGYYKNIVLCQAFLPTFAYTTIFMN